jgi:hypothetical protein
MALEMNYPFITSFLRENVFLVPNN